MTTASDPPPAKLTPKCPVCGGVTASGEAVGANTWQFECDSCGHEWKQYIPD